MALTCNIDTRGRKARLVSGVVLDTVGTVLLAAGLLVPETRLVVAGIVVMLVGGFVIFEGAAGWCALRAMGFKTKL